MPIGSAPAMYVPIAGMNCDTVPSHKAKAKGDGTPIHVNAAKCNIAERVASNVLE